MLIKIKIKMTNEEFKFISNVGYFYSNDFLLFVNIHHFIKLSNI